MSPSSDHPELRVTLVIENLRQVWAFRESNATAEYDLALDWTFKLFDMTMTAVEIIEQASSNVLELDFATDVRKELLPFVSKCLALFLQNVSLR